MAAALTVAAPTAVVRMAAGPTAAAPMAAARMEAARMEAAGLHSYNRCTRLNNRYRSPAAQSSRSRCKIKHRYVCLPGNRNSCRFLLDLRRHSRIVNNQGAVHSMAGAPMAGALTAVALTAGAPMAGALPAVADRESTHRSHRCTEINCRDYNRKCNQG